jgi:hypothetical protein
MASAVHGESRVDQDVDFVADVQRTTSALVAAWRDEFYVDEDMIREAVREQGSFNIIYLALSFKADVFISKAGRLVPAGDGAPPTRAAQ